MMDLSRVDWRKSSRSTQQGNCVEVAATAGPMRLARDSKNPTGAVLAITPRELATFLGQVKKGTFDLT